MATKDDPHDGNLELPQNGSATKGRDDIEKNTLPEPLSNFKNIVIVLVFETLNSAAYYVALSIGLLKYLSWGLSIIQVMQGVLIYSSVETLGQVLAAVLSDKTQSRLGRRKPFILVGNIIQFVSVFFLCLPPTNLTNNQLFAWFISFSSLSWGGFMFYFFPFKSWLIENSVDDEDYRRIRSIAVPIGALLGGISGTLLMVFSPVTCAYYNLIGGFIALALMILFTPTKPCRETDRVPQIIPSIRLCSQSKEFLQVFINQIFIEASAATYNAIMVLLLITSYAVKKEITASVLYLVMSIIGGIIGVAFNVSCNWIFTKVDKLEVYNILLLIAVIVCVITFFISFDADNLTGMIIIGVIIATIGAPANLIYNMFIRDLVIYDTFVTEYKRANMYISAILIPSNIISKFLSQIPIVVITLIGFKSYEADDDMVKNTYSWTTGCTWAIRAFSSFFIASFTFICYLSMRNYPLTGNVVNKMNEIITQRDKQQLSPSDVGGISNTNTEQQSNGIKAIETVDCESPAINNLIDVHDTIKNSNFTDDDKQLLLHLSKSELYRIFSSFTTEFTTNTNTTTTTNTTSGNGDNGHSYSQVFCSDIDQNQSTTQSSHANNHANNHDNTKMMIKSTSMKGLHAIWNVVISSFSFSIATIVLLIIALVYDSHHLDGIFSTLLIYLVLLMAFLVVYEIFRLVALQSLSYWSAAILHDRAKALYHELMIEKESVHNVIKQVQGIDIGVIDEEIKVPSLSEDNEEVIVHEDVQEDRDRVNVRVKGEGITMTAADNSMTTMSPTDNVEGTNHGMDDIEDYPKQVASTLSKVRKSEEDVIEEEAYFSFGYEYIILFQLICLGLAIFVIAYAVNK